MFFPVDPLIPNAACVLQYQQTHLRMGTVCPKVKMDFFDDGSKNGIEDCFDDGSKNEIEADFLKEKWEVVLKIHVPATQQALHKKL
jgi:hypothetical protein